MSHFNFAVGIILGLGTPFLWVKSRPAQVWREAIDTMAAWLEEEEARLERSLLSDCEKLAQVRLEKQRSEGLARELDGILARIALLQRKTLSAEARGSRAARVEIDGSALQHVDAGGRIEEPAGSHKVQVAARTPVPASATAQPEKVDTPFTIDWRESFVEANKQTTGEFPARRALANDKLQGGRALADSERKICEVLAAYLKTQKGNQGVDLATVGHWLSKAGASGPAKTEVGEFFEKEYCTAAGNEAEELKIMYKVVKAQHRTLSRFITASGLFVIKNCPDNEQQPRVHLNDLPSAGEPCTADSSGAGDCLQEQSAEALALAGGRTGSAEPRLKEISAAVALDAAIAEVEQAPHRIISLKESDIPTVASTVLMNHEPAKETQQLEVPLSASWLRAEEKVFAALARFAAIRPAVSGIQDTGSPFSAAVVVNAFNASGGGAVWEKMTAGLRECREQLVAECERQGMLHLLDQGKLGLKKARDFPRTTPPWCFGFGEMLVLLEAAEAVGAVRVVEHDGVWILQRGARVAVGSDKWSPLAADVSLKFAVDMNALPIDPEGCGLARVDESKLLFQVKVEEVEPVSREIWHKPKRPPSAGAGTRGGGSKQFWLKVRGVREGINHVYLRLGIQSEASQKTTAVGEESKARSVIWGAFSRHPLGLCVKLSNGECAVTLVQGLDAPHGGTTRQHDDRWAEREMNPTGAAESARGSMDEEDSLDCRAYASPVAAEVIGKRKSAATPAAKALRGTPAKKGKSSPGSQTCAGTADTGSACGRPSTRSQNKA